MQITQARITADHAWNQPRSCRDPRLARKRDHKFARSGIQVRTNL